MSDINRKEQTAFLVEADDLSVLAASKNLHKKQQTAPANSDDLASASIASSDAMRVTQRGHATDEAHLKTGKIITNGRGNQSEPVSQSVSLTNSKSRSTPQRGSNAGEHGILKNPFYRYDGGLINKILALIGNILKVLERIFLRLLGMRDVEPANSPKPRLQKTKENSPENDHSKELEREKRKQRRELSEQLVQRQ